ncbi:hypothetical protein MMC07_007845 [Pseudocyphellaria aurata]|nr:hypothetical protein [Pseudocyphellaria aurata]
MATPDYALADIKNGNGNVHTHNLRDHDLGLDVAPRSHISLTQIDAGDMYRLGKTQELNRNFRFISIVGFAVVLMGTWEGQLSVSTFGLIDGGLGGLIWCYVGVFSGFIFVYASMAEMASMAPTSGGQYHWVSEFAPKESQKFLSYITGWICVMGWQTGIASVAFLAGTQIQGLLVLNVETYVFHRWHGTLLVIAVSSFSVIFNTVAAKQLPMVEGLVLILHVFGFFAILIPLWVLAPRNSASVVFTQFTNNGGWSNLGLSCLVGMLSSVFTLLGADSATHMSEEIKDASLILPRSIMASLFLNGALGFIMLVTYCFCLGDVGEILGTTTGYPFIQVFYNVTNSHGGASAMTAILITLTVCGCISNVATASRQLFAFARDGGMPFSPFLAHIKPGWNIPLNAVMISLLITICLSLINIGSTVAFNAIASLGVASLLSSYIISFSCLIVKRYRGEPLPPARWSLGRYGMLVNGIAVAFLSITFIFSFFPLATPVVPSTMNWNVLIYFSAIIFAVGFYFVRGKHVYAGPVSIVKQL